jgi:hypothetical protein
MTKTLYLNNRELLREIHNSKSTFCSFSDDIYKQYDYIAYSLDDINTSIIKEAQTNKADRLTKELKLAAKEANSKKPVEAIQPDDMVVDELVFRVMTNEHIPIDPEREKKAKTPEQRQYKVNFPAFKHYIIESFTVNRLGNYKDLVFKEVGRSHWVDGLSNGHFSLDHGRINNNLARMLMKLVDRYAQRGNWRGYTYIDEMKSQALLQLSQTGLQFNEAKSSNPFSYYTEIINNSFTRVLNIEKKNQNIRDDLLIANNSAPSFSRQLEHEEEMKRSDGEPEPSLTPIRRGRGRRPASVASVAAE